MVCCSSIEIIKMTATRSVHDNADHEYPLVKRLSSIIFYAVASFMITVVNKTVLTSYGFPSYQVLGLGQMVATIVVLGLGRHLKIVHFPSLDSGVAYKIWPLPLIYLGNMATGLGGTKELNLPMFTALRRFSIMMTMIGERIVLGVKAPWSVKLSVSCMVVGALIAAADDVTFSWSGYTLVLLNDVFTASNGVYMKKKLDANDLGKYGLMFYNALFMIIPAALVAHLTGDIEHTIAYSESGLYQDPLFLIQFFLSCIMGFILNYSVMLCTQYNSALTTTIIGCLKNIFVTYLGMVMVGDYVFTWLNFIGLNISVLASLMYTYIELRRKHSPPGYRSLQSANASIDTV